MSKCLTLEDIKAANDLDIKKVETPEWGGHVYVKAMTGLQWAEFEKLSSGKSSQSIMLRMIVWCTCDEDGNSIFDEKSLAVLAKKSIAPQQRIANAIMERNIITDKDIEEAAGN